MQLWKRFLEKLNPAQPNIYLDEGYSHPTTQTKIQTLTNAYDMVEVVNRCVNFIVDNNAMLDFDIKDSASGFTAIANGVRKKTLDTLLNRRPNPYMDINTFRRLLIMDFIIDGNAFVFFDGTGFYHLPACNMEVIADEKHYVNSFLYDGTTTFTPNQIIHIKDNSISAIYRGDSRLNSNLNSLYTREFMTNYQQNFFQNGTAVGLIIETEAALSKKMKDRKQHNYNLFCSLPLYHHVCV